MSKEEDSENDSAPLRPVSSLRSHFERIAIPTTTLREVSSSPHRPKPTASVPVPQEKPQANANQHAQNLHARESPPTSQTTAVEPLGPVDLSTSISKPKEEGGSTRKLAVSDGRRGGIHDHVKIGTRDIQEDDLPAPRATRSSLSTLEPVDNWSRHDNSHTCSPGRLQLGATGAARKARSPIPPPVNRAEKPKIAPRPVEKQPGSTLAPYPSQSREKVSPFSTPPSSSEGSPGAEPPHLGATQYTAVDTSFQGTPRFAGSDEPRSQLRYNGTPDVMRLGRDSREKPFSVTQSSTPSPPREAQTQRRYVQTALPPGAPQRNASSSVPNADETKAKMRSAVPPPPPRRTTALTSSTSTSIQPYIDKQDGSARSFSPTQDSRDGQSSTSHFNGLDEFPDVSKANRQPPHNSTGSRSIVAGDDVKLIDVSGNLVCTVGHYVKLWALNTGELLFMVGAADKESRPSAIAFKAAKTSREEGSGLWIGTNYGELRDIDISKRAVVQVRSGPHERREIVKIHRYQNSMWTIDDSGRLCAWFDEGSDSPSLNGNHLVCRVAKGHTFSLIVQDSLWYATGKEVRIYKPTAANSATFETLGQPLIRSELGAVTSGTVVSSQMDRVYLGHADGKISIYSTQTFTCLNVVAVNVYKINALVGVGSYLWVAFSIGTLSVYDTHTKPWVMIKTWTGHPGHTISNLIMDRSNFWKTGLLRLLSSGSDGVLRCWDGRLAQEWRDDFMRGREVNYCSFDELTLCVITWNAGATTPGHLRHEAEEARFFTDLVNRNGSPDIIVFGFQELVDLEDKKLTAKSLFKGNKRKDPTDLEHMSHQYRAWKDYLVHCMEGASVSGHYYDILHTTHLIGLFSCIFVKASQRFRVRSVDAGDIKRGMGGLHGNKGAIAVRFLIDDTSVCLVNCHLAAGQTQTSSRNSDITAILDSSIFRSVSTGEPFVCGGDGSMVLDHEICVLNGDLNYRIDTMSRDTVIKAVNAGNLPKLLERDQLLVSRRRNPLFPLRAFSEAPITFAPTYKYDVGADSYDTSDKRRSPAWCDRILCRGLGHVKQMTYDRHNLRASDHRPVSACFRLRIRHVDESRRMQVASQADSAFAQAQEALSRDAKIQYLRDVLGVPLEEAAGLV